MHLDEVIGSAAVDDAWKLCLSLRNEIANRAKYKVPLRLMSITSLMRVDVCWSCLVSNGMNAFLSTCLETWESAQLRKFHTSRRLCKFNFSGPQYLDRSVTAAQQIAISIWPCLL